MIFDTVGNILCEYRCFLCVKKLPHHKYEIRPKPPLNSRPGNQPDSQPGCQPDSLQQMTGDKAQTRMIRDNELVSANNPFPEIPVTVPQIIRQAGHRTYQRGVAYRRNREVIRYSYDEDERTLTGLVNGSTIIPYEVTIRFFPAVSGSATFTARCTCPVLTDCKHAVALMLTALDRASVAKKALSEHPRPVGVPGAAAKEAAEAKGPADSKSADVAEAKKSADPLAALRASGALTTAAKLPAPDAATAEPENTQGSFALNELGTSPSLQAEASATKISAWRRDLSSVLSARQDLAGIDSMRVSGALDFSLSVSGSYARGRNMPGATPSINLLARPLMASKTGRWIKGGLSWETFASSVGGPVGRHEIYPEHERFFAELYSIARPWQNMYSSHRDWISISASASTLLWDVLARAEDIGLPLLVNGREVNYAVLSPAQVRLHATASEDAHDEGAGLQLQAALSWEGREGELLRQLWLPAAHCHPIGTPRTGFFALGGLAQQEYEQAAKAVHWKTARPGALDEVGRESFVQKSEQEAPTEEAENSAPTIAPVQGERVRYSPAVPELPEGVELALIPLVEPLDAASESLISAGTVHIPAAERATFQKEYLPALSRSIPSLTPDPALALPRVKPPHLVLEISFDEQVRHDAQLSWRWEYPLNPSRRTAQRRRAHRTLRVPPMCTPCPFSVTPVKRAARCATSVLRRAYCVRCAQFLPPTRRFPGWRSAASKAGKPASCSVRFCRSFAVFPLFRCVLTAPHRSLWRQPTHSLKSP